MRYAMKKILLVLVVVSLWISPLQAQRPILDWTRAYGIDPVYPDIPFSIQQTADDGFIIAGYTQSQAAYNNVLLLKTDLNGNQSWVKSYGGGGSEKALCVQQTFDAGYILVGYKKETPASPEDIWLLRTDANGDTLWTKTFGGEERDIGRTVLQTPDSGYIIAGHTMSYGQGSWDVYLLRTDVNGDILWTKTYGGVKSEITFEMRATLGGGYIIASAIAEQPPSIQDVDDVFLWKSDHNIYLLKIDDHGNTTWSKVIGGGYEHAESVDQCYDGGYILTGLSGRSYMVGSRADMFILKTSGDGDLMWYTTYDRGDWGGCGYCVRETADQGLIIAARVGSNTYILLRTDAAGDTTWIVDLPGDIFEAWNVEETDDGGYVALGHYGADVVLAKYVRGIVQYGDLGFRPNPDGWQFQNDSINMWPQGGVFPDWDLFVSAFGNDQCYFIHEWFDAPEPRALKKWRAIWGWYRGSCFGFAVSSLLFFSGNMGVPDEFPGYQNLYFVPLGNESRNLVNTYQLHQFGKEHQRYVDYQLRHSTPIRTLLACNEMFNTTPREYRIISLHNNNGTGAHAVTPYRCEPVPHNPAMAYIYVYDSNAPGNATRRIEINTSANTWQYAGLPGWGGPRGIFLWDPVRTYTQHPLLKRGMVPRTQGSADDTLSEYVEVYTSPTGYALIQSSDGKIGIDESALFSDLPQGHHIIPENGAETLPIGYFLPDGVWTCSFGGLGDSTFTFSLFADSTVFAYQRDSVSNHQDELFRYGGNGAMLSVMNPNAGARRYTCDVICTRPASEVYYGVSQIGLDAYDSTGYMVIQGERLQIENYSEPSTYDLRIEILDVNGKDVFAYENVELKGHASHRILPNWRENNGILTILVDSNMAGYFADTMRLSNQVASEDGSDQLPESYNLMQNYPNPFNPSTTINYELPKSSHVTLKIYNTLGQEVATLVNAVEEPGYKSVEWNASGAASGVYFYRLQAGDFVQVRKLLVLR
jgi:hypothetical protein